MHILNSFTTSSSSSFTVSDQTDGLSKMMEELIIEDPPPVRPVKKEWYCSRLVADLLLTTLCVGILTVTLIELNGAPHVEAGKGVELTLKNGIVLKGFTF